MYIKESVFWAIVSGAIMFGIVLFKSIRDYLVHIKYLGDGYKMVFSFETVSLATLYVSVLFALVFIVVLKKKIEDQNIANIIIQVDYTKNIYILMLFISFKNTAILLTNSKTLNKDTKEYIKANTNIKNIIIVGGEKSISSSV